MRGVRLVIVSGQEWGNRIAGSTADKVNAWGIRVDWILHVFLFWHNCCSILIMVYCHFRGKGRQHPHSCVKIIEATTGACKVQSIHASPQCLFCVLNVNVVKCFTFLKHVLENLSRVLSWLKMNLPVKIMALLKAWDLSRWVFVGILILWLDPADHFKTFWLQTTSLVQIVALVFEIL